MPSAAMWVPTKGYHGVFVLVCMRLLVQDAMTVVHQP